MSAVIMRTRSIRIPVWLLLVIVLAPFTCLVWISSIVGSLSVEIRQESEPTFTKIFAKDKDGRTHVYDRNSPVIFVGGIMRSGTTLMRAMLETLPEVRCGEETHAILKLLEQRKKWMADKKFWRMLQGSTVTEEVLDDAFSSFILEVMAKHGEPTPRLCNKDPYAYTQLEYLGRLFPNAKFILMLRDGRAIINSVMSRELTEAHRYPINDPRKSLEQWNRDISAMYDQCLSIGDRCFLMHYEQLVLKPEQNMRRLLEYLELPWNESVLNHEEFIATEIQTKNHWSSGQVAKPINTDALAAWVGSYPPDVVRDMPHIAPMLQRLGYDPLANPPNYGEAEDLVLEKTKDVHENREYWKDVVAKMYLIKDLPAENTTDTKSGDYTETDSAVVMRWF